ncbi:TPA: hypothetical protein U1D20_000540 [Streptococcus suis]|nr:hypothetical protein [Streptococcus suis]
MKKKKFVSFVCSALLIGVTLTACSSNQSTVGIGIDQAKTVGFMQLANENKERIWFKVRDSNGDGEVSKDDDIAYVYRIKGGKADTFRVAVSSDDDITLSDIKNMNDKDILSLFKELDKMEFDEWINGTIGGLKEYIKELEIQISQMESSTEYSDTEALQDTKNELERENSKLLSLNDITYENALKLKSNYPLAAVVETDSSGNQVVSEVISFRDYIEDYFYEGYDATEYILKESSNDLEFQYAITGTIYDQTYKGYYLGDSFLVTSSLDDSVNLGFDTLDTKNVTEE